MQPGDGGEPGLRQNRSFVLLFGAQLVSLFGSGVTTVALALLAAELAGPGQASAVLGVALMLRILAFLLVSQPAACSPTAGRASRCCSAPMSVAARWSRCCRWRRRRALLMAIADVPGAQGGERSGSGRTPRDGGAQVGVALRVSSTVR
jgi:hypothetical protein